MKAQKDKQTVIMSIVGWEMFTKNPPTVSPITMNIEFLYYLKSQKFSYQVSNLHWWCMKQKPKKEQAALHLLMLLCWSVEEEEEDIRN